MKTQLAITEQYLRNTELPVQTDTYTVIPHSFVIDTIRRELAANNFTITEEKFYEGDQGDVAEGEFYIENNKDPEMAMLFHWQNSYNKRVKFGCAIAGMIYDNNTTMIGSTGAEWLRKHTGTALDEAEETIKELCAQASEHFDAIIEEKQKLLSVPLTEPLYGKIMGTLFFEKEFLTQTQAIAVHRERKKPMFEYTDRNTLWGLYKYLMFGIQDATVGMWQVCQQRVHMIVMAQADAAPVYMSEIDPIDETPIMSATAVVFDLADPTSEPEPIQDYLERTATEDTGDAEVVEENTVQLPPVETIDETDSELVDEYQKEDEDEDEKVVIKCMPEQFIDHMLDNTKYDAAMIYQYAGEHFQNLRTLEENVQSFTEWASPKEESAPEVVEPIAPEPVAEEASEIKLPIEEVVAENPIDLMAELTAAGGVSIASLDENDMALLQVVEQKVAATTVEGVDFLELKEPVIDTARNQFADRIEAAILKLYKRTDAPYEHVVVNEQINIKLLDTSEVFYLPI